MIFVFAVIDSDSPAVFKFSAENIKKVIDHLIEHPDNFAGFLHFDNFVSHFSENYSFITEELHLNLGEVPNGESRLVLVRKFFEENYEHFIPLLKIFYADEKLFLEDLETRFHLPFLCEYDSSDVLQRKLFHTEEIISV